MTRYNLRKWFVSLSVDIFTTSECLVYAVSSIGLFSCYLPILTDPSRGFSSFLIVARSPFLLSYSRLLSSACVFLTFHWTQLLISRYLQRLTHIGDLYRMYYITQHTTVSI